ncbi:SCO1/SenC family protein, partial [Vibrio parahaemolyticus V-223/04]
TRPQNMRTTSIL